MKTGLSFLSAFLFAPILAGAVWSGGCGDNTSGPGFDFHDGSLTGQLAVYVSDDFDGRTETRYALRSTNPQGEQGEQERGLLFDTDPLLAAGTVLKIWGTESTDGIRVTSFKTLSQPNPAAEPVERVTESLRAGTTNPLKRLAFVVVDIGGGTSLTQVQAQAELTGALTNNADPPLRNYYVEASYGTQDIDGQAFQLSYPMTTCDTSKMSAALKPMVMSMGGGAFNHYLWYFGSKLSACTWAGLGEVGTPDKPADDTWYNNSASCVVMVQEPGHNFGMQHSSSMKCGTTPAFTSFNDVPDGNCVHSEYGDRFDPMGGGCRHMNGWQKTYNGWLQGCNVVQVKQSGTFTLVPLELPCDGIQMLQIPMPKTRTFMRSGGGGMPTTEMLTHYYLELRTARGVDANSPAMVNSVHVRVSGPTAGGKQRAVHTWILDMIPATTAFDGMLAGTTFTDPAGGVTFAVSELDTSHAKITVTMDAAGGGPTCLGGAAFTEPGPGIESCSGAISMPGTSNGGGSGTGTGGAQGTGGAPGTGGRAGTGGAGGRAGTGGTGVISTGGAGGRVGTGGGGGLISGVTGGVTGSSGGAGVVSTGGTGVISTGSGGQGVSGGGSGVIGTGGSTESDGSVVGIAPVVTSGCSCAIDSKSRSQSAVSALVALMLLGGARTRRRRRP